MHPAGGTWAIRRWESNLVGTVTLTGHVGLDDGGGDGVGLRIFVDGREVYSQHLTPGDSGEYSVPDVKRMSAARLILRSMPSGTRTTTPRCTPSTIVRQNDGNPNPPRNLRIQ